MGSVSLFPRVRSPWLICHLLWCVAISMLLVSEPALGQGSRSIRGAMRRVRALQAKQKQQSIRILQSKYSAAQTSLSQAESELMTASPALQAARSQLATAQEREAAMEQEIHDAARKHHELENHLVASQSPESPVGKAASQFWLAQLELDRQIHRILSLPGHPAAVTEADLAKEQLQFTTDQKHRLKADAVYERELKNVESLKAHFNEQQRLLFENDPTWKESHDHRQALARDLKALEENRKSAAAEVAMHLKQVNAAQLRLANARQMLGATSTRLNALGAAPAASAKK